MMNESFLPADIIAEKMMLELIKDRSFQRQWIAELADALDRQIRFDALKDVEPKKSPKNLDNDEVSYALDNLTSGIQLAVETFLRSLKLAEPMVKFNNESATLYSVRVQLDRFVQSDRFIKSQCLFLSRRLSNLVKTFTIRVSSVYDAAFMSIYATTLCDMLFRFEEYTSIHYPSKTGMILQKTVEQFHLNVVKGFNSMPLKSFGRAKSTQSLNAQSVAGRSMIGSTYTPLVVYRKAYSDAPKQKSFLLPADLRAARQRIQRRTQSVQRLCPTPNRSDGRRSVGDLPATADMEKRWRRLVADDEKLQKEMDRSNPQEKRAMNVAVDLTREVLDELAKHIGH